MLKTIKKFIPSISILAGRVLAIGFRYLGILYLGYSLSKEDFANFNLINSGVVYLLFFIGFDYYNKLHRSYFEDYQNFRRSLSNYVLLLLCSTPIVYIISSQIVYSIYGKYSFIYSCSLLLISYSELIYLELYRFEILKTKLQRANFWLFTRYLWILFFSVLGYFFELKSSNLVVVWGAVSTLTLAILLISLYPKVFKLCKVNFSWATVKKIIEDLRAVFILFAATLLIRGIYFLDKWIPEWLDISKEIIATYAFAFTLSSSLGILIDVTLTSNYYGELLRTSETNHKKFLKIYSEFNKYTSFITILFFTLSIIAYFMEFEIQILGFKITSLNLALGFLAQSIYNAGLPDHYALFCKKLDRKIFFSNLIGLLFFIITLTITLIYFSASTNLIFYCLIFSLLIIWIFKKISFYEFKN